MMDIAHDLARMLATSGFGTLGDSIFVGQIPSDTNGLYVIRTGGTLNYYNPIQESVLDIYCKDTSSDNCVTTLEEVKRLIHRMHSATTPNGFIYSILAIGDIEDVERDLEYFKLYKITVSVLCRDNTLIS